MLSEPFTFVCISEVWLSVCNQEKLQRQAEALAMRDEFQREQDEVTVHYRNMKKLLAESNVRTRVCVCV